MEHDWGKFEGFVVKSQLDFWSASRIQRWKKYARFVQRGLNIY